MSNNLSFNDNVSNLNILLCVYYFKILVLLSLSHGNCNKNICHIIKDKVKSFKLGGWY